MTLNNDIYVALLQLFEFLYIFAFLLILVCLLGIFLYQDSVYSVLLLIVTFLLVAFVLLLVNLKFLAFTFILVYVGAVALLFIFIVFMVGPAAVNSKVKNNSFSNPFFLALSFKFQLLLTFALNEFFCLNTNTRDLSGKGEGSVSVIELKGYSNDINIFSSLLYTEHFFLFFLTGTILLLSMVGALILSLNRTSK
jgi:NADH-quinone oxidoreductase subunit J